MRLKGMMKKGFVMAVMLASCILAGCDSGNITKTAEDNKDIPQSVSIVAGIHKHFPRVSFQMESIYSRIYNACFTYGNASVIVNDGEPFVAGNYNIKKPDKRIDSAKRKQIADQNIEQIVSEVSVMTGKTPEVDTLSGVMLSANILQGITGNSEKTMIIMDSGLSTTSVLNFLEPNLIYMSPESIVAQLEELHEIPNLEDIDIVWIGLGETCGEQDKLTADYKYKLQNIWKAVLEKGGAKSIYFDPTPLTGQEYSMELPECSTVPVIYEGIDIDEMVKKEIMPDVIKWDGNSSLQFHADTANFLNIESAKAQLQPVAIYLIEHPEEAVYIFGMTATTQNDDPGIILSEERAAACGHILENTGVKESQIKCIGLGEMSHPLRVEDIDENGNQIKEKAQENRAVVIVNQESVIADLLLKCAVNI